MSPGSQLIHSALRQRPVLSAISLTTALLTVSVVAIVPWATGYTVDIAVGNREGSITLATWMLAGSALAAYAFAITRRYITGRLAVDVQHDVRLTLLRTLHRLDGPGQDALVTGQVVSRSISDLNGLYTVVVQLPIVLSRAASLFISLVIAVSISPVLSVVSLMVVPVLFWLSQQSRRWLYAATWASQQAGADVATHVEHTVSGVRVVKAFGQEQREVNTLDRLSRRLFAVAMRTAKITARYQPLLSELPRLALVVSVAAGGYLVLRGNVSLGDYVAFTGYLTSMTQSVSMLSSLVVTQQLNMASVERLNDVLSLKPHRDRSEESPRASAWRPTDNVGLLFDNVFFGDVLQGLSLKLIPSQTTVLIGPPGVGKSMAIQLAAGFYLPDAGQVCLYDSHQQVPSAELSTERYLRHIACVFEDSSLLSASVRDNITMGGSYSDAEITNAARIAQAHDFISDLPLGYDTMVGERGMRLSGGQRQRIVLARAIITQPSILLLDDATSAVDASTEEAIAQNLRRALPHAAVLVVAHRRSSLALADSVIVLDQGRVAAEGPLAEVERTRVFETLMEPRPSDITLDSDADHYSSDQLWPVVDKQDTEHIVGADAAVAPGPAGPPSARAISATPQLLADVERLPNPTEAPALESASIMNDYRPFTVLGLLSESRRLIALAVLMMVIGVGTSLAIPALTGAVIDRGVREGNPDVLWWALAFGIAIVCAGWAAGVGKVIITARAGERLLYSLRVRSFAHLNRQAMSFFDTHRSGAIMTRMTTDIDALSSFLKSGLAQALTSTATLFGVLTMLVVTDAELAMVAASLLPVVVTASVAFRSVSRRLYAASRKQVSRVNADFQEQVSLLRDIQMCRADEALYSAFSHESSTYQNLRQRAQLAAALYFPGIHMLSRLATAIVLAYGAPRVIAGDISAGVLVAFTLYLAQLFGPIQQLGMVFDKWQRARISFGRISDFLSTKPGVQDSGRRTDAAEAARGQLQLNEVTFSYPTTDKHSRPPVAQQLDLSIEPGTTVALVGPTGAGKSTVVKLLARFYDPDEGTVTASHTDIREFPLRTWRPQLAQVPQEAYLFMASVADNIRYGRPDASDREIEEAVRRIGALGVIADLDGGFNRIVGERGLGLSSGQRQIIALARTELMHPDVMLLDEATATLDPATESAFLDATERATEGRTCVVVTHRLATAQRADRIVVIDQGKVVEDGNHDQLVAAGGLYARMWRVHQGV